MCGFRLADSSRQNKQPGGELDAADAIASVSPKCGGGNGLIATVRNLGTDNNTAAAVSAACSIPQ